LQGNIDSAVMPIAMAKPDAVFLIASGNALYAAVKILREKLPATTPIYTVSTVNWKDLIKQVGLKSAKGVIVSQCVPYPYSSAMPIVKGYLEDIKTAGKGDVASYYGLEGYLGAAVTVEALRRAGPNLTRQGILDALMKMGKTQIGGFEVNYSAAFRQGYAKPDTTLITSQGTLLR
jgi:ABC-type branched-subunit amino acid transport system substrate-binding protein